MVRVRVRAGGAEEGTVTGKRRIDRILDGSYLDGIEEQTTDEIRRMRDECEEEESGISYARRVLQGRLDILRAEALRRRDAGSDTAESLLDRLPRILSDDGHTSAPGRARPTRFLVPPSVQHHRRAIDRMADDRSLADIRTRSEEELTALADDLATVERELSVTRRQLLDRIDRLQEELIRRYKSGTASVSDLLASGS